MNSDEGQAHSDAFARSPVIEPEYRPELGSAQTLDLILGYVCQHLYSLIEEPTMMRNSGRGTLNLNLPRPKRKI